MSDLATLDLTDSSLYRSGFPHALFTRLRREAPVWSQAAPATPRPRIGVDVPVDTGRVLVDRTGAGRHRAAHWPYAPGSPQLDLPALGMKRVRDPDRRGHVPGVAGS